MATQLRPRVAVTALVMSCHPLNDILMFEGCALPTSINLLVLLLITKSVITDTVMLSNFLKCKFGLARVSSDESSLALKFDS